ncbi:Hypothetical predicted protein [Marmota monax]|uniref:Uncharacterized protein n=1 Tax=Marmota monax TaxID=9995 RepID=A0A5E4D1A6_MARMO|nr:Hypothetical predicted protein [Marmota monax]
MDLNATAPDFRVESECEPETSPAICTLELSQDHTQVLPGEEPGLGLLSCAG